MYIERLQVESEGFLANLDVKFSEGLNVVIGARGTGKTSLIELIRFCLGAGAFTEDAATRGNQQAVATLAGGAVTVTLRDEQARYEITRSAGGHFSYSQVPEFTCTVLAQNEVETVGAQAAGRLLLLDRFRRGREQDGRRLESTQARLRSLTVEIAALIAEGRTIIDEIEALKTINDQLSSAQAEQFQALQNSQATKAQQDELQRLQETGRLIATREAVLSTDQERLSAFESNLDHLSATSASLLQPWPANAGEDLLAEARNQLSEVQGSLRSAVVTISRIRQEISSANDQTVSYKASIDTESRQLRQLLNSVQVGIGQASRRVAELEEKKGRLEALSSMLDDRRSRYNNLAVERDSSYRDLDQNRTEIYDVRNNIAARLNETLAPTIRIKVTRSEDVEDYRLAIVDALRGSGIHYNTLAPQLAKEVSPHELTRWVENGDAESLANALSIRTDRAQAVISSLGGPALGSIISASIEDGVSLELLDGPDYKPSDQLSIGQRCTVVLPVLLGNHGDPLIVDQPEDHLDNAFIASTLVNALKNRSDGDQLIFSSHNANVPVLGEADRVIVMQSDGEHGYVTHQGGLDLPKTVSYITQIMEGGMKAFATRSAFYDREGAVFDAER